VVKVGLEVAELTWRARSNGVYNGGLKMEPNGVQGQNP